MKHLMRSSQCAGLPPARCSIRRYLDCLPRLGASQAVLALARAIRVAADAGRPVVAAIGGHVIKQGCGPILCDLVQRGYISHVAMVGAAAIHDAELAMVGSTSEDVGAGLEDGTYGQNQRTLGWYARSLSWADGMIFGLGQAMALDLSNTTADAERRDSVLDTCYRLGRPATVHVAVGTDTPHQSGLVDGAALGSASMRDFRTVCEWVRQLRGGVWLNIGSAVVLPEVFLKALAKARADTHGREPRKFTVGVLDFAQPYRALENVARRPGGTAYVIQGAHELTLPLLRAAIIARP